MILDKEIEFSPTGKSVKYYKELGYPVEHKKIIPIKVEHLPLKSHALINVKCDNCEAEKQLQYMKYVKNTKNFTLPYCCRKCATQKIKNTCFDKYGIENFVNTDKAKKTKKELYGNENYNNREQSRDTCIKKYGVEHVSQIETTKNKARQTCLLNHGVEYTLQSKELRDKGKKTMLKKYNNENYRNSTKIKETHLLKTNEEKDEMIKKMKKTNLEKFGVEHFNDLKKMKETTLKNWNVEYPSQNKEIRNKIIKTNLKKYGVENPMQDPVINEKQQISGKKLKLHKQTGLKYRGGNEKHFLDYCFEHNIKIEKAPSIKYEFENKIKTYHPDFYLKDKNLIIEIKSAYYYERYLNKNLAKQKNCLDQGYNFIFIIDFNYNYFNSNVL